MGNASVLDSNGIPHQVVFVQAVSGGQVTGAAIQLATNQTVAANSSTAPKTQVPGGSYLFDVQFTGTSIKLQSLGADATTWRDVITANASGTYNCVLGDNSTVRLTNPNGTQLTGVSASLS